MDYEALKKCVAETVMDAGAAQEIIHILSEAQDVRAVMAKQDPVAWRVKDYADGWILCRDKTAAEINSKRMGGALFEPLYSRPLCVTTKVTGSGKDHVHVSLLGSNLNPLDITAKNRQGFDLKGRVERYIWEHWTTVATYFEGRKACPVKNTLVSGWSASHGGVCHVCGDVQQGTFTHAEDVVRSVTCTYVLGIRIRKECSPWKPVWRELDFLDDSAMDLPPVADLAQGYRRKAK